jgi:hypothetical protein
MPQDLFSLEAEDDRLQPTVIAMSPEALVEMQFKTTIGEALDNAFWRAGFSGTISQKLNLKEDLKNRFLRSFRNDPDFGAELTRGADIKGNLEQLLVSWVKGG